MLQLPQSKASPDHSVWVPIANQPDSDWNPTARLEDWLEAGGSTPTDGDRGGLAARDPGRHRHPETPRSPRRRSTTWCNVEYQPLVSRTST